MLRGRSDDCWRRGQMSLSDKLRQVAEWELKDARSDGTMTFLRKKVAETINYID